MLLTFGLQVRVVMSRRTFLAGTVSLATVRLNKPPGPPGKQWDVYLDGLRVDVNQFGIDAAGTPYYDETGVPPEEAAVFGVDEIGPYLVTASG